MIDELADPMRVMTSLKSLNRGNASNRRDKYSVELQRNFGQIKVEMI